MCKRKARLLVAAEEAFTHIKRLQDEQGKKEQDKSSEEYSFTAHYLFMVPNEWFELFQGHQEGDQQTAKRARYYLVLVSLVHCNDLH